MIYVPKVKPPFDEIEIENRFTRSSRNGQKPYLMVSFECLEAILAREDSVIAREDIPRLLAALCGYAITADISDRVLAEYMENYYEMQQEDGAPDE